MIRPRSALRHCRPIAAGALVAILVAGVAPGPFSATARGMAPGGAALPSDPAPSADAPDEIPSIAYEEWLEHEDDDIEFTPGGRVEVGFTPRKDDRWPVGGAEPGPLPAGRASGRDMAKMPNGSRWADVGDGKGVPGTRVDGDEPSTAPSPASDPVDMPGGESSPAAGAAFAQPAPEPAFDLAAASGLRRQVYGFLPYWEVSGASTKLNYDVLSTIAYFSVGATAKGNLKKKDADGTSTTGWGGWTSSSMTKVINAAHQKGTRVVLTVSVFAWTSSQASVQKALLGSSTARLNLVKQTVAAVRDRGADGVNLDFEPLASGYADEFVALLKTFRSEFNKIKSGYQIVYDTTGYIGNYPLEASVGKSAADAIFVMGYDYRTAGSATSGSIDPLSGRKYDLADTVRAYTARVSPSRLILGIPWYGRAWSTESDAVRSKNISGLKYGYSSAVNYESVVAYVEKYGRKWDSTEQSPYVVYRRKNCTDTYGCVTSWRQIYYGDAASMKRRYALVNDYGLRGTGMWALGYDGGHSELYRALSESFLVDKAAPVAGVRNLATTQVNEGFVVKWAGKDVSSIVAYDVQVSRNGGAWEAWLTGTKATSDVYLGAHGAGYAFRVRAKDSKGHLGSWNVVSTWSESPALKPGGFGRVAIDGLSYRTGPDTSAAKLGALDAGTIVSVTRGPVSADGYAWYEVTQPVKEWSPVSFVERGVWVAASNSSTTFIKAYRAPNSTTVKAGIRDLDFGSGSKSAVGSATAAVAARAFSPNGDGSKDTLKLRWTNGVAMESLTLNVYRTDGSLAGSRSVPDRGAGAQSWSWDGKIGGTRVKDGTYVLQLKGTDDGTTYRAPSARPVTATQVALYGVRVDTVAPTITDSSIQYKLISPNGDGIRDSTKLAVSSTGATRWTATYANAAGNGGQERVRERWQHRRDVERAERRRLASRRRTVWRLPRRVRRGRQLGTALMGDHRRHDAAHREARLLVCRVLAQRRRDAGHDGPLVVRVREGHRHRTGVEGHDPRPVLEGVGPDRLEGDLGRPQGRRDARQGREVHVQGGRAGRRGQPAHGVHDRRGGSDRKHAPLVAPLLPAGQGRHQGQLEADLVAQPRCHDDPAHLRPRRHARADRLDGQGPGRRHAELDVERQARRRDVCGTGQVQGGADREVAVRDARAGPLGVGGCVRDHAVADDRVRGPVADRQVHDHRAAVHQARRDLHPARQDGRGGDGDEARGRVVQGGVHGEDRRVRRRQHQGVREGRGWPDEPHDDPDHGGLVRDCRRRPVPPRTGRLAHPYTGPA